MIPPFPAHQVCDQCTYEVFIDSPQNEEQKAIQESLDNISFLSKAIPSLCVNDYKTKKKYLIDQAQEGLRLSHDHGVGTLEKICNPEREGRILSEKTGIYKKQRNVFKEALVWELSVLLGCDRFICPSLPIHIHGEEATFQPYYAVSYTHRFVQDGAPLPKKIDIAEYWILCLYTLLIGHSDLNGTNLHYTENGYLLLDNDCSFPAHNHPIVTEPVFQNGNFLNVPLQNVLLDFADAKKPLSNESYRTVIACLENWRSKKEDLEHYLDLSALAQSLDQESREAFWERWHKITETFLSPDTNLRSWFEELFPGYFRKIETAQQLALEILSKDSKPRKEPQFMPSREGVVGPMSALHLFGPCLRNRYQRYQEFPEIKKIVEESGKWIQVNYMDP